MGTLCAQKSWFVVGNVPRNTDKKDIMKVVRELREDHSLILFCFSGPCVQ
jgi:hypothetical protein